jgi:hypothetical protein
VSLTVAYSGLYKIAMAPKKLFSFVMHFVFKLLVLTTLNSVLKQNYCPNNNILRMKGAFIYYIHMIWAIER